MKSHLCQPEAALCCARRTDFGALVSSAVEVVHWFCYVVHACMPYTLACELRPHGDSLHTPHPLQPATDGGDKLSLRTQKATFEENGTRPHSRDYTESQLGGHLPGHVHRWGPAAQANCCLSLLAPLAEPQEAGGYTVLANTTQHDHATDDEAVPTS